jgi:RNA polymerase sigma-70 factor (ECF subfamily)
VTHNLALKRRMANQRIDCTADVDVTVIERTEDPNLSPEQQLLFQDRQAGLMAIVRALPEQDERCLRLRAEGLKYREIADVLGISLGGVSVSLNRSLDRLRRGDRG